MAADTPPVPEENAEEIIDLTELIERGDTAPAPDLDAHIQSLNAQPEGEDAEIEALLAQMDANDGATVSQGPTASPEGPAAAPGTVDPHEQLDMSDMGDIDNLLASLDIPPQPRDGAAAPTAAPQSAPAPAPAAPVPDLDADLDALLNETATAAPSASATPGAPDLDADLDSLLTSLDAETQAPEKPAEAAPDAPAATEPEAPAPHAAPVPDMAQDLPEAPAQPAAPVEEAVSETNAMPPVPEAAPEPAVAVEAPAQPDAAAADMAQAMAEAPESAEEPTPEDIQVVIPMDAPAPAASATSSRAAEDFAALAGALGERLRQCEADLAAARARIEALEHSTADSVSLGDLLREGSPLHNGFAALIASSVGQALKDTPPACLPGSLEERIATLETHEKSLLARTDALEGRVDSLEPRFNEEVGKAAAGAVARILREEISRLAGG